MSCILDAKYSKADLYEIAKDVNTLDPYDQRKLESVLHKHESLFDGTLGQWKDKPYEIKLKDDVTPHHSRPFLVPYAYKKALRMEVERLCKIGVLKGE